MDSPTVATTSVNRFAGPCSVCGAKVPAGEGTYSRRNRSLRHAEGQCNTETKTYKRRQSEARHSAGLRRIQEADRRLGVTDRYFHSFVSRVRIRDDRWGEVTVTWGLLNNTDDRLYHFYGPTGAELGTLPLVPYWKSEEVDGDWYAGMILQREREVAAWRAHLEAL